MRHAERHIANGRQLASLKSAVAPVRWLLHIAQLVAANIVAVVPASALPRTQRTGPANPTPCHAQAMDPALYWLKLHEWLLPVHPS